MKYTKKQRMLDFYKRMEGLGLSYDDIQSLRRIEMTLHSWSEQECNGDIERDEKTGKPFRRFMPGGITEYKPIPLADREKGSLKRLAVIMAKYPTLHAYHQTDPRGCALYIVRDYDLFDKSTGKEYKIDEVYNRGYAVCY